MHILILKGKGREWGPVYRDYLQVFTHGMAEFSEVDTSDIKAVNEIIAARDFDGYILTGSTDDAHDSSEYVLNLIERVQELYAQRRNIVGICYGHQLVARALGGETGPSEKGWGTGPRCTPLVDSAAAEFLQSCAQAYDKWQADVVAEMNDNDRNSLVLLPPDKPSNKSSLNMYYSHQDQVNIPPSDTNISCLNGNDHCPYAGFYSPDGKLFTMQGHPEFDTSLMLLIIDMLESKGLYKKMGYTDTLEDIKSNISACYGDDNFGHPSLLDNIYIGKCIIACILSK